LNLVDGVEHDHALGNFRDVLHEVSAVRVAAAGFDFVHNAQRET
jgi:hypothetical protein